MSGNTKFEEHFGIKFSVYNKIHLDAATVSLMPFKTVETIANTLYNLNNVIHLGTDSFATKAADIIHEAKNAIREFLQLPRFSVTFSANRASIFVNWLFANKKRLTGKKILISSLEEHSLIAPLLKAQEFLGFEVDFLDREDEKSLIDKIAEKLTSETALVVFSSIVPANGIKRDYEKLIKLCEEKEILTVVDISNMIGHEKIEFKISPSMILIEACRGLMGPTGMSIALMNPEISKNSQPLVLGNFSVDSVTRDKVVSTHTEEKFETESLSIPLIAGITQSVKLLSKLDLDKVKSHETRLRQKLLDGLKSIDNIKIIGDEELNYGPIISFSSEKFDAFDIAIILEDLNNVVVRSGAVCSSMFINEFDNVNIVRISTHLYNTEEEISLVLKTLNEIFSS